MGSVTFHDSYSVSGIGRSEQNVRINFSESYNASTNSTTVTFSSCEIASNLFLGNCVIRGETQFNGTAVKTYPTNTSSYTASIGGGTDNYATVTGGSGSSITVRHNASGQASFTIKLVACEGSYFGAAYNGKMFGVASGSSKSYTLTTHTSTLTINPNGGAWNSSTSSQSFSQAPTSTKTIANPTRANYRFTGWTKSGGGSLSGTTYTYGASNGTLTANWEPLSYTVTCEDRVGSETGVLLGSNTETYIYGTTANGSDFGNNTTYNFYYTGYYYSTFTSSVITQNTTIYRIFLVNNYTLSIISSPTQGATISVNRTSSPNQMADIGSVTNGSLIYYGDVLSITYTVNSVYQLISATVNNVDISQEILPYNITVSENIVLSIVTKLGAIIYIGNEAYQAFIGNGSSWIQYQAYIGNGTSFDQY